MTTKQAIAGDGVTYTLRTRVYQDRDAEQVKKVFISGVCEGPGSALPQTYRNHLTSRAAFSAYSVASLGVVTTTVSPLPFSLISHIGPFSPLLVRVCGQYHHAIGIGLVVAGVSVLAGGLLYIRKQFVNYVKSSLANDLSDIPRQYGLTPVGSDVMTTEATTVSSPPQAQLDGRPVLVANGVSGFWVAEARRADSDEWEVVGCVGLRDDPTSATPGTAILYRMMVSSHHRKMGIAGTLLDVLVDHAKARGVRYIVLTTMQLQVAAQKLYAKHGWELTGEFVTYSGWMPVQVLCFRNDLGKAS